MKICFIHFGDYPESSFAAFYEYTQYLSNAGNQVTVYCRKIGRDATEMKGNVIVKQIYPKIRADKFARVLFLIRVIFLLRREHFDIIHTFWTTGIVMLPLFVGKRGKKWVLDIRTSDVFGGIAGFIRDKMKIFDSYFFDAVSILGDHLRKRLYGTKKNKKHYIFPMGVNPERFKVMKKDEGILRKLNITYEDTILIYIGRLDRTRNLDTLLLGFKKASHEMKKLKLLLVGGTKDDVKRLKEVAKQQSVDKRVIFMGLIPYKDVPKYLNISDAGIAYMTKTGVHNAQPPLKTLEYLASSLPIIATDTDGNKDYVIDGYNGVLCTDNTEGIGLAIVRLLNDKKMYNKIKTNARESVSKYEWGNIVNESLMPLYENLVNN